jgi:protein ImuB
VPLKVNVHHLRPSAFRDGAGFFEVKAAYGPWKTNGCWWSTDAWNLEEWDVLAQRRDGLPVACLLVHDAATDAWLLEAMYD